MTGMVSKTPSDRSALGTDTDPSALLELTQGFFQFSFRTFLWLFTAAIVSAWILRQAMRGSEILIALAGLAATAGLFFVLCMGCFLIGWFPAFVAQQMGHSNDRDDPYGQFAKPPKITSPPSQTPSLTASTLSETSQEPT